MLQKELSSIIHKDKIKSNAKKKEISLQINFVCKKLSQKTASNKNLCLDRFRHQMNITGMFQLQTLHKMIHSISASKTDDAGTSADCQMTTKPLSLPLLLVDLHGKIW